MKFAKPKHLHLEQKLKNPKHIGVEYAMFEKYDGWFAAFRIENGQFVDVQSFPGNSIKSLQQMRKQLRPLSAWANGWLIAEATIPGMKFHQLNGLFNQQKRSLSYEDDGVVFMVHDMLLDRYPHSTCRKRYERASDTCDFLNQPWMQIAPLLGVSQYEDDWMEEYRKIIAKPNGEGLILKAYDSPYKANTRNYELMKIKCELTLDLLVVGIVAGMGKYANTLGALEVKDKDGNLHKVSGMSDNQRDIWWANPSQIIGQVVEVKAMKKEGAYIREPRFKAVRHDKLPTQID